MNCARCGYPLNGPSTIVDLATDRIYSICHRCKHTNMYSLPKPQETPNAPRLNGNDGYKAGDPERPIQTTECPVTETGAESLPDQRGDTPHSESGGETSEERKGKC